VKPMALPGLAVFSACELEAAGAALLPNAGALDPSENPPAEAAPLPAPKVNPDPEGAVGRANGFEGGMGFSVDVLAELFEGVLGPIGLNTNVAPGPIDAADLAFHGSSPEEEDAPEPNWKAPLAGAGGAPKSNIGLEGLGGLGGLARLGSLFCLAVAQDAGGSNFVNEALDASLIERRHF